MRRQPSVKQKESPQKSKPAATLILDFQFLKLLANKFLLFKPADLGYFFMMALPNLCNVNGCTVYKDAIRDNNNIRECGTKLYRNRILHAIEANLVSFQTTLW